MTECISADLGARLLGKSYLDVTSTLDCYRKNDCPLHLYIIFGNLAVYCNNLILVLYLL